MKIEILNFEDSSLSEEQEIFLAAHGYVPVMPEQYASELQRELAAKEVIVKSKSHSRQKISHPHDQ